MYTPGPFSSAGPYHLGPIINPLGLETPGLPRFKSEVGGVKDSIVGCVDHWKENHLYFPCWSVSS